MEQTFNERHVGEILKPCNIDAYIRIDERGVWPKAEYDETEGPDLFLWSPAQAFRGEPGAPEEADTPMLPLPSFTARDLAAFMAEGVGALVAGHYGEWDDGPDPASLKKIDPRSHARTAIVQAYAARREAQRIVGSPPLALIAEADRARKAWREATTEANVREGVSDSIPGTEDSRLRRERAKASTAALDSEMEATAEAARAAQETWLNAMVRQLLQRPATPAPMETVETASNGPAPLTRNEIANCFAGLRGWDVNRWKAELSSPDDWLKACQQRKGTRGRGGYESTWWPVCIACAMVDRQDTTVKWVSARFKNQEPLKPWLDTWQTYHPDNA